MTQQVLRVYERFNKVRDIIDEKEAGLASWQTSELNRLAQEAESVLSGCRRNGQRGSN